ncbi:MAG: hypothetical protein A2W93_14375 [Bacteroidetes bacterium GWF2_43_63]|nr:MAG: hypothetical protein A2W94_00945 [Bacteroidetes bacterium GWE2_42_42]OFY52527.1 MAG: hypothetical protein A2W93_14375 [Bacteroidetes bacterium GWF2_43_63]HBG71434.1 hypothetical protein [Bacteroidales bacterium]HCB60814.1 hypothetical protein [Bacteroidales bacterium]HCY23461.1 hypothetical protein [Bacteroidales bacterium]
MKWPYPEYPLALVGEAVEYTMPKDEFVAGTVAAIEDVDDYDYVVWRIDLPISTLLQLATEMSEIVCKGIPTPEGLDFDAFSIDDTNTTLLPAWVKKSMRDINNILFAVNKDLSIASEYNTDPYGIIDATIPTAVTGGTVYLIGVNYYYATADIAVVMLPDTQLVRLPDNFIPTGKVIHYIKTPVSQGPSIQDVRQSIMDYYMNNLLVEFYRLRPGAMSILPIFMSATEEAKSGIGLVKSKPFLKSTHLKSRWP